MRGEEVLRWSRPTVAIIALGVSILWVMGVLTSEDGGGSVDLNLMEKPSLDKSRSGPVPVARRRFRAARADVRPQGSSTLGVPSPSSESWIDGRVKLSRYRGVEEFSLRYEISRGALVPSLEELEGEMDEAGLSCVEHLSEARLYAQGRFLIEGIHAGDRVTIFLTPRIRPERALLLRHLPEVSRGRNEVVLDVRQLSRVTVDYRGMGTKTKWLSSFLVREENYGVLPSDAVPLGFPDLSTILTHDIVPAEILGASMSFSGACDLGQGYSPLCRDGLHVCEPVSPGRYRVVVYDDEISDEELMISAQGTTTPGTEPLIPVGFLPVFEVKAGQSVTIGTNVLVAPASLVLRSAEADRVELRVANSRGPGRFEYYWPRDKKGDFRIPALAPASYDVRAQRLVKPGDDGSARYESGGWSRLVLEPGQKRVHDLRF
jgi:hypothetical protein